MQYKLPIGRVSIFSIIVFLPTYRMNDYYFNFINESYPLLRFGMSINSDSVTRSAFYKYLHPKEVFIAEGVLVPDIARKKNLIQLGVGGTNKKSSSSNVQANSSKSAGVNGKEKDKENHKFSFVYPYGASLNVQRPSIPLLSSGPVSYPMHRPLAAVWEAETVNSKVGRRGRMVVLGSVEIFGDDWLDKEENAKLCDILMAWMLDEADIDINSDRNEANISDYRPVPSVETMSQVIKPCLQGMDELPRDFTRLFDLGERLSIDFCLFET